MQGVCSNWNMIKIKAWGHESTSAHRKPMNVKMHTGCGYALIEFMFGLFSLCSIIFSLSLSTILKTCSPLKLLSRRTSKVSTKQSEPASTSAIHFKESFVAYCYKHARRLGFCLRKSNFWFQMSKPFGDLFSIPIVEKVVRNTIKLKAVCKIFYKLLISSTVENTENKTSRKQILALLLKGRLDGYRNSPHYLACGTAWLHTRHIDCT